MTIAAITENHPEKDFSALFPGAEVKWMATIPAQTEPGIAAYVDLDFVADPSRIEKLGRLLPVLVFVNAVTPTLQEIGRPFIRINAWPGFATLRLHELVIPDIATETTADRIGAFYRQLDCRYLTAPDVPGMISARVVAGIINEAWYTWEEKVSTQGEIDTAMRLGTNYPYGPFEWGERIGLGEVTRLLLALSKTDERYTPAGSLLEAADLKDKTASKASGGAHVTESGTKPAVEGHEPTSKPAADSHETKLASEASGPKPASEARDAASNPAGSISGPPEKAV